MGDSNTTPVYAEGWWNIRTAKWLSIALLVVTICRISYPYLVWNILGHEESKVDTCRFRVREVRDAIDEFRADCGRYPTDQEGFRALKVCPPHTSGWRGPYLPWNLGLDVWGNPYHYELGPGDGFKIESYGADGKPGGDGDDADIVDGLKGVR